MQSIAVVKTQGLYQVLGYNEGAISVLFESKSEGKCDDFADNYAIANGMYYSHSEKAYFLK